MVERMTVVDTGRAMRVPEEGMLVRARGRMWVVTRRDDPSVEVDELGSDRFPAQHVVELSSVEDDARGETIKLVWEAEPGTQMFDSGDLPAVTAEGFDDPEIFGAYLDAVRWGAITNADSKALQSPFRSGIAIQDHQLAPLARALAMARVSLLVADDVGLGKTIEAGLIAQELRLRHQADTIMVVCPPNLCGKWQAEMDEKFGLRFEIIDSDAVKRIRRQFGPATNPFVQYPLMIVSGAWLKLPAQQARLDEILSPDRNDFRRTFDLLIVDEAHQAAPAAVGRYAQESKYTKLLRRLAPHFEHRVFLTATPHNGYSESFQALLELVDPLRYARGVEPDERQLHTSTMVRRLKSELRDELPVDVHGRKPFPIRKIDEDTTLVVTMPDDEIQGLALLDRYRDSLRSAAGGPKAKAQRAASEFITLLLKKRFLSSPTAFAETIETHAETVRSGRDAGDWSEDALRGTYARVDDDYDTDDDLDEATADAVAGQSSATGRSAEADQLLGELLQWGADHRGREDAKTKRLFELIEETCQPTAGWNDERIIVFTEYRDTLDYLRDLCAAKGWLTSDTGEGTGRVEFVFGGMDKQRRAEIIRDFNYDPSHTPVRVLFATDTASEGIDLHKRCHRLVHMEVPFNPNRLEQRNGRVDRYGQPNEEVWIYHFLGRDGRGHAVDDMDFLVRVAKKINEIREDLGSASPVLATQIEERLLGGSTTINEAEIERRKGKTARLLLSRERKLAAELADIRTRLTDSTTELGLSPDRVKRVVDAGLLLTRQTPLRPGEIRVGTAVIDDGLYEVGPLAETWADTTQFHWDAVAEAERPITFDHELAARLDQMVVYAHLGHPLVSRCLRLLRSKTWQNGSSGVHRVTARMAPVDQLTVVAHARVVITGGDGARLHEEIAPAALTWNDGKVDYLGVNATNEVLELDTHGVAPAHVQAMLADLWPKLELRVRTAITSRAEEVARQRNNRLDARRDEEKNTLAERLNQLQQDLQRSLSEQGKSMQLELPLEGYSKREQYQIERDWAAMQARLDRIPGDIVTEQAAIDRRYQDRTRYTFPIAVTFLVPEGLR